MSRLVNSLIVADKKIVRDNLSLKLLHRNGYFLNYKDIKHFLLTMFIQHNLPALGLIVISYKSWRLINDQTKCCRYDAHYKEYILGSCSSTWIGRSLSQQAHTAFSWIFIKAQSKILPAFLPVFWITENQKDVRHMIHRIGTFAIIKFYWW